MSIRKEIFVTQKRFDVTINITQGTDLLPIEFVVADYTLPEGSAAVVYARGVSKQLKKLICDISDNVISFTPEAGFFEEGLNALQVRVVYDYRSLFSYKCKVNCHGSFSDDDAAEVESQPTLVEQLLTDIGQFSQNIDEMEEDVINIPRLSVIGQSVNVYVSKNGNDETGDGSPEKPYASVEKAMSLYNYKPNGAGMIIINILDEGVYEISHKQVWEGAPHISGTAGKEPTLKFTDTSGTGFRFYSCHTNINNVKIDADYGSIYFEGCSVSMSNVELLCGVGLIGCTVNIINPIINTSKPFENTGLIRARASIGRISGPKVTTDCDYPAFYFDFGSNISITGNLWSVDNATTTTKAVVYMNYSDVKISACPSFAGYENVIESNNGNIFTSATGYNALIGKIKQTNTLIKYGNHDLSKLIGLVKIRKINVGNLSIEGNSVGNLRTESIALEGYYPICVVNTLIKNAEIDGVNSSSCNPFYSDIDGDCITLAIKNSDSESANIEINVVVLYIRKEYYSA